MVHYPRASTNVRLICFPEPRRLDVWCAEHDQPEAIVAGFFVGTLTAPSATLVHRGHLLNRPYSSVDQPAPESRPVVTALAFESTART